MVARSRRKNLLSDHSRGKARCIVYLLVYVFLCVFVCAWMSLCVYAWVCVCTCERVCVCMCVSVRMRMWTPLCVCVCVCVCVLVENVNSLRKHWKFIVFCGVGVGGNFIITFKYTNVQLFVFIYLQPYRSILIYHILTLLRHLWSVKWNS